MSITPITTPAERAGTETRPRLDADQAFAAITKGGLMTVGAHAITYSAHEITMVAMIHPRLASGRRAGRARKMRLRVDVTPMDLYRVRVDYVQDLAWVMHWEDDSLYAEDLARAFVALDSGTEHRGD